MTRRRSSFLFFPFQALVVVAAFWAGGLIYYAQNLETEPPSPAPQADGIVTLTGGSGRLDLALDLLREGKGERLLISGVNASLSEADLRSRLGLPENTGEEENAQDLFACCIDVDQAQDTIGNAAEIANWSDKNGYKSLILVTASYHLPRSRLEISRLAPKLELIAYPVVAEHVKIAEWYRYPGTARLLAAEYSKYFAALVRQRLIEPVARSL